MVELYYRFRICYFSDVHLCADSINWKCSINLYNTGDCCNSAHTFILNVSNILHAWWCVYNMLHAWWCVYNMLHTWWCVYNMLQKGWIYLYISWRKTLILVFSQTSSFFSLIITRLTIYFSWFTDHYKNPWNMSYNMLHISLCI